MTQMHIDNVPLKIAAFLFSVVLLFRPGAMLFVTRGFRSMPTSNVGLIVLRAIGALIICQIAVELIWGVDM